MNSKQLTLNFDAAAFDAYDSCREFVGTRVVELRGEKGMLQKAVAADMDLSPSQLTRKLAQSPGDSARFTLDDLENYVQKTKDTKPIFWLADRYLKEEDTIELLEQKLAEARRKANAN